MTLMIKFDLMIHVSWNQIQINIKKSHRPAFDSSKTFGVEMYDDGS